jgi:hypothetical protein
MTTESNNDNIIPELEPIDGGQPGSTGNNAASAQAPAEGNTDEEDDEDETFPTLPDADGWHYENAGMKQLGIATKEDEAGDIFKRVELSRGRRAEMRELSKKEAQKAASLVGKNGTRKQQEERLEAAYIFCASKFTDVAGKPLNYVLEDILEFKAKDWNRLSAANGSLNF